MKSWCKVSMAQSKETYKKWFDEKRKEREMDNLILTPEMEQEVLDIIDNKELK